MTAPLTHSARDRLRAQVRREQELAARVLGAESRLAAEIHKRDATLTAHDRVLAERRDDLADALVTYIDEAGVGLERAAIILGRSKVELTRIMLQRGLTRNTD